MVFHAAKAPGKKLPSRLPSCWMTTWSGKCVWMPSYHYFSMLHLSICISSFPFCDSQPYKLQYPNLQKKHLGLHLVNQTSLKNQIFEGHVLGVVRLCSSLAWAMNVKRLWNHHTLK